MASDFRIVAQPAERFAHLFTLTDEELAAQGARRSTADHKPGFPCRVSLADAEVGEQVILTPFRHHDTASPYQATGPIFVREGACQAELEVNAVPEMLLHRLLSVRAYDANGIMIRAEVSGGERLSEAIKSFFEDERAAYLHVHNAGPGCFNCRVERV